MGNSRWPGWSTTGRFISYLMKTILLTLALVGALTTSAQGLENIKPAAQVDLGLAGQHLEKAGKQRNTALLVGVGLAGIAGMVLAVDSENSAPAVGLLVCGVGVSVGLNIGANGHERKAGRILQGR
jgi:hypothetical protein